MNELFEKVKFNFGNNEKYNYFIIDEKSKAEETEISTDSLAYKIGGPGKYKISKYAKLPFGNYDFVLEIQDKLTNNFRGLTLVTEDEIERL